jgi:hypothetical protein
VPGHRVGESRETTRPCQRSADSGRREPDDPAAGTAWLSLGQRVCGGGEGAGPVVRADGADHGARRSGDAGCDGGGRVVSDAPSGMEAGRGLTRGLRAT